MIILSLTLILTFLFSSSANGNNLPVGKKVYTIQVGSFKEKENAFKLLQKVKEFPQARVSYRKGYYYVRVGLFKDYKEALSLFNSSPFKKYLKGSYITIIRFNPKGVYFAASEEKYKFKNINSIRKNSQREKKRSKAANCTSPISNQTGILIQNRDINQNQTQTAKVHYKSPLLTEDRTKIKENKAFNCAKNLKIKKKHSLYSWKSYEFAVLLIFLLAGLSYFAYVSLLPKKNRNVENLEVLVSRFLDEGNCEKLKEVLTPIIKSGHKNTFLMKVLADCYLKEKEFIKAAALYEDISEILRKKGFEVLADSFEAKAKNLMEKEFRRG